MDREVTGSDRLAYEKWIDSITTPPGHETAIAWQLAKRLQLHPTRTIRAMRGQKGTEDVRDRVERAVANEPEIEFWQDGPVRKTRFKTVLR